MDRRHVLLLTATIFFFVLTGCNSSPTPTAAPDQPVTGDDEPVAATAEPDEYDTSSDGEYIYGEALVDSLEIVILETFPAHVQAIVRGALPDDCTEVDQTLIAQDANSFVITLTTRRPADMSCAEAEVPFEQMILLDTPLLEPGVYMVTVNGVAETFNLSEANVGISPDQPPQGATPGSVIVYGEATVTGVEILMMESYPVQVSVVISGTVPDACTEIAEVWEQRDGNTIILAVQTSRPQDMDCAQVITDFEYRYTLEGGFAPGDYTLDVNGFVVEFHID